MTARTHEAPDRLSRECATVMRECPDQSEALRFPLVLALLDAAIAAVEDAIPDRFEHEGHTYRLHLRLSRVDVGIYPEATSAPCLLRVETEGLRWCGFQPGQ